MESDRRVVYTVPTPVALRGVGVGTVGLGGCIIATSVLLAIEPARPVAVAVGLVLALATALALLVLAVGVLRLVGRGTRLVLYEDGFVNATGPGVGVRRVAWQDVRKVQIDGRVVVVGLAGGKQSQIRTAALEIGPNQLARELRDRLGQRREPRRQDS
ncbi:MAG: hypothetical protein ACODAF_03245 [Actinomycetota bacterium]